MMMMIINVVIRVRGVLNWRLTSLPPDGFINNCCWLVSWSRIQAWWGLPTGQVDPLNHR